LTFPDLDQDPIVCDVSTTLKWNLWALFKSYSKIAFVFVGLYKDEQSDVKKFHLTTSQMAKSPKILAGKGFCLRLQTRNRIRFLTFLPISWR
jgi:hypothetical protein